MTSAPDPDETPGDPAPVEPDEPAAASVARPGPSLLPCLLAWVAGAVLLVVAPFLAFTSFTLPAAGVGDFRFTVSGWGVVHVSPAGPTPQYPRFGIVLVIVAVLALVAVAGLVIDAQARWAASLGFAASVAGAITVLFLLVQAQYTHAASGNGGALYHVGIGNWLGVVGGALVAVAGLGLSGRTSPDPVADSHA